MAGAKVGPGVTGFSPLHEGDTSVATAEGMADQRESMFQSPSRGGHLRGQPAVHVRYPVEMFQSPSRGGHLRGAAAIRRERGPIDGFSPLHEGDTSVARQLLDPLHANIGFSPLHEGDTSVAGRADWMACRYVPFQSPSRGGHLRGRGGGAVLPALCGSFSPLHEGDTSVALKAGGTSPLGIICFSPLHEGDTSVAYQCARRAVSFEKVSVPFTRGTPPWLS